MDVLSGIRAYLAIGIVAAFVILATWGLRVNSLRAKYHGIADSAVSSLATAGFKNPRMDHISADIAALAKDRQTAHDNWAAADRTISDQSGTINDLHAKSQQYAQQANAARQQAQTAMAERDKWISTAKQASTRTDEQSSDAEVAECRYAMGVLFDQGF